MSETVIFRAEGTSCVVYCPKEAAGIYIPAQSIQQAGMKGEALIVATDAPTCATLEEAWIWHLKFAQRAVAEQHNIIDAQYADALYALKKKAASLHAARVLEAGL